MCSNVYDKVTDVEVVDSPKTGKSKYPKKRTLISLKIKKLIYYKLRPL